MCAPPLRPLDGSAAPGPPELPSGMDWDKFRDRFDRISRRMVEKMGANARFMASSVKKTWDEVAREMGRGGGRER